jgi:hypothetical protein
MLYITDQNKDRKRKPPPDLEGVGPEMLSYLCPDLYVLKMRSWKLPAWTRFFDTLEADAEQVAELIKECKKMPVKALRIGLGNALKEAVPPIEIRTD